VRKSILGDSLGEELRGARRRLERPHVTRGPHFLSHRQCVNSIIGANIDDFIAGLKQPSNEPQFILEEVLPMAKLAAIVDAMARAAASAGVHIVTGDTKVVERGHGDGIYINTAGIGELRTGINVGPRNAMPGDAILVSGTVGDHGMAIISVREGLEFESQIRSDCAPLNGLIDDVLSAAGLAVHAMRDPTRGGLASTLNEIAQASGVGIALDEASLPVRPEVQSACELLGFDPVYVANEGKVVFFVAPEDAEQVLATLRAHPLGRDAARIGAVTAEHPRLLVARTAMGSNRVIPLQIGEQLPRIC